MIGLYPTDSHSRSLRLHDHTVSISIGKNKSSLGRYMTSLGKYMAR